MFLRLFIHLKRFISNLTNRRYSRLQIHRSLENFSTAFKFQTAVQDGYIIWEDKSLLSELRQEVSTVQSQIAKVVRWIQQHYCRNNLGGWKAGTTTGCPINSWMDCQKLWLESDFRWARWWECRQTSTLMMNNFTQTFQHCSEWYKPCCLWIC